LPGDDRPVAQFMYQNDAGRRLTLYVVALAAGNGRPVAESAFRFERVNNVSVFTWSEDGSGYALSGDVPREELMPIARLVYEDLNAPPQKGG
jgi:anti-sigma factor RsiW